MSTPEQARQPRRSRAPVARDQQESAFTFILRDLVRRIPGAYACALVDRDGEAVDYFAHVDPFDIKVAAAHWRIVVGEIAPLGHIGALRTIVLRAAQGSTVVRVLPDGYALVILLGRRAFPSAARALDACERALAVEAEWSLPGDKRPQWVAVEVDADRRRRPVSLTMGKLSCAVEVLGALVGLRRRECGYRVRLPSGHELNLVREPGNRWYADEHSS